MQPRNIINLHVLQEEKKKAYNANYNKYPIRDFQYSGKKIADYCFVSDLNEG
jgi:hypothetical protein